MSKKSIAQLKRDSKMLDQILGIVADMVHEDDRPMFDAILTYWRNGWKTMTPIERVALDDRRRDWRIGAGLGNLNKVRATVSQVGLLMLEDVHPEIKEEAQTNDGNAGCNPPAEQIGEVCQCMPP